MTIKQKQALLAYLGYYEKDIDGKWGPGSKSAANAFRNDYGVEADEKTLLQAVNGTINPKKPEQSLAIEWDGIKYFKKSEFKCKCGRYCDGYPAEMDLVTVRYADEIRKRIGKPLHVNSGLRCKQHNANVGGVSNSQHMLGCAVDLACPSGVKPAEMKTIAEEVIGNTGGIGLYSWGIHIDSRKTKARWNG